MSRRICTQAAVSRTHPASSAQEYTRTCQAAAVEVLARYSTSFSLAVRTLPPVMRTHITSIYAMARVADEIVDGSMSALTSQHRLAELNGFEDRIAQAVATGCSADVIAHAYASTARAVGIGPQMWEPFFASMRADITPQVHTPESAAAYIHGSAEVIGLMCVQAFFHGEPPEASAARIRAGAMALGAAFQKVNFLRDLAEDTALGRSYLPTAAPGGLDDAARDDYIAEIEADLRTAAGTIGLLPARVRPAVRIAHALFSELNWKLARTPAEQIRTQRARVSNPRKLAIAARVLTRRTTTAPAQDSSSGSRPDSGGDRG